MKNFQVHVGKDKDTIEKVTEKAKKAGFKIEISDYNYVEYIRFCYADEDDYVGPFIENRIGSTTRFSREYCYNVIELEEYLQEVEKIDIWADTRVYVGSESVAKAVIEKLLTLGADRNLSHEYQKIEYLYLNNSRYIGMSSYDTPDEVKLRNSKKYKTISIEDIFSYKDLEIKLSDGTIVKVEDGNVTFSYDGNTVTETLNSMFIFLDVIIKLFKSHGDNNNNLLKVGCRDYTYEEVFKIRTLLTNIQD